MRISDWSSDVCSSDLADHAAGDASAAVAAGIGLHVVGASVDDEGGAVGVEHAIVAGKRRPDKLERRAADLARLDGHIEHAAVVRAPRLLAPAPRPWQVPVRAGARAPARRSLANSVDV